MGAERTGTPAGSAVETVVIWQPHQGPRLAAVNGYDIIACEMCGFRHAVPLPEPAALEQEYREKYYSAEKPTFLVHAGEDQEWAKLAQSDRLESFERLLGRGRRRLLDVGSGPGFFLRTAQERGWQGLGIEPSRQAAAHARSMGVEVVASEAAMALGVAAPGGEQSEAVGARLLEHGIVVSPGTFFGPSGEGYVRFALVPTLEECERAAGILREAL